MMMPTWTPQEMVPVATMLLSLAGAYFLVHNPGANKPPKDQCVAMGPKGFKTQLADDNALIGEVAPK